MLRIKIFNFSATAMNWHPKTKHQVRLRTNHLSICECLLPFLRLGKSGVFPPRSKKQYSRYAYHSGRWPPARRIPSAKIHGPMTLKLTNLDKGFERDAPGLGPGILFRASDCPRYAKNRHEDRQYGNLHWNPTARASTHSERAPGHLSPITIPHHVHFD